MKNVMTRNVYFISINLNGIYTFKWKFKKNYIMNLGRIDLECIYFDCIHLYI